VQLNLLVLSYVAAAAISASVAALAWHRRRMVGARELALLMFAVVWWLTASALEAASVDRAAKIAWSVISYPGIQVAPVLYLLFMLGWTRQDDSMTRPRVLQLLLVPIISVGMAATNEWHHLLWATVALIPAWGVTAVYAHGPWFLVEAIYAYGLIGAGLVALSGAIYRYPGIYGARLRLVVAASLVPIVGSLLYAAGLDSTVHADLSSIAFAIAGLVGAWAVLRARLLDVVPVSWPRVVDALADAVLVLDAQLQIAAINLSAARLLGVPEDAVGKPIDHGLGHLPQLVALCREPGDQETEIPMHPAAPDRGPSPTPSPSPTADDRWLHVAITAFGDARGRNAGYVVALRDVTERRTMVHTIQTLSLTDELTGLLNRRGFTSLAEQQLRTSLRTGNRIWLLFADLDGLKAINDRLGHEAGDRALCEIASVLRTGSVRNADLVARLGGDEFAILSTEISRMDEANVVRRVEEGVARVNARRGRDYTLSLSAGVAVYDPARPQSLDALISEADEKMYRVKYARRAATRDPDEESARVEDVAAPVS
jgi:diguanylate cyclase (GGDEF)-like protein